MFTYLLFFLLLINPVSDNGDLTITHDGETIETVERSEFSHPFLGAPTLDLATFDELIERIDEQVYQEPVNAFIDDTNSIQSGENGYKLNRKLFTELFYEYAYSHGPATIEAPKLTIYPKVDSELLANIRIQKIGQYVTFFNNRKKGRTHNIKLALAAIDNHVVFPGETFSFNKVVGKRTPEKGYLPAPVIIRGKLFEGIGGGICQVSSTLFNAVDDAGVEIIQRYSHSKRVPYVPPGRDATVSWYGPDFVFKNNYNQPILIRAKAIGGMVQIIVYSSERINRDTSLHPTMKHTHNKQKQRVSETRI
ncbi:VanW family protein [Desertibacillus haloalkaliphilus]|uniref:VanW family protein n=1 Tax=Desertibacillus haloalkaliphilus TaxID=1328930 RepID=UPI001C267920|nr:VanW family protein [Desertibacillus haloalkaliphilus]MBU8907588.1 VanW family protein [Desertibacillus haloalkaliphilus]